MRILHETPPSLMQRHLNDPGAASSASVTAMAARLAEMGSAARASGGGEGNDGAPDTPAGKTGGLTGVRARRWWDEPTNLEQLRADVSGRISIDDFVALRKLFVVVDARFPTE